VRGVRQLVRAVGDNGIRFSDNEISFYDNGISFYDNGSPFYDNEISSYDNGISFYDNGSPFYDNRISSYDNGIPFYDSRISFYAAGGACGGRQREGAARQCVAPLRPGAVHRVAVLQAAIAAVRRPAGECSYTKVYSMICDPGSVPD
jgi:hypothetical protein